MPRPGCCARRYGGTGASTRHPPLRMVSFRLLDRYALSLIPRDRRQSAGFGSPYSGSPDARCLAERENVMSPKPERPTLSPPKPRPHGAPLALAGIRVADFSHFIAGPLCSMILADLGAEVIKIEKADGGDDFRRIRPPVTEQEGAPYLWTNRNKKEHRARSETARGAAYRP